MLCAGLMSGTSLDGVDAALIETDGERVLHFGPGAETPYTASERAVLQAAVDAALAWRFDGPEPAVFAEAEAVLTETHARAIGAVCEKAAIDPAKLDLVGFHGQTVIHIPPEGANLGRTLQLGDGEALAKRLDCAVAFDFRTADMDAGGRAPRLRRSGTARLCRPRVWRHLSAC